jgi:O-antigen/teichoic acid export membrane protein
MKNIWRSGIIFTAANLFVGMGNVLFQIIIGHRLATGEFGLVNTTIGFMGLLGLPMAIATTAITHYIARFNFSGDDARLRDLLAGCHKFLLRLTIGGSLLAILLAKPLSDFFHFPRLGLMVIALVSVLAGLWGGFATALCQGLGWFKRLALISILTVTLRLLFGALTTGKFPNADWAVTATGVSTLSFAVLLFWKQELTWPGKAAVSPWDGEFIQFLIVAAAFTGGQWCFTQGDLLVISRHKFLAADQDAYTAAGVFARSLPMTVAPLLTVLFTHRSAAHTHGREAVREQFKLLGLYGLGLVVGAAGLLGLHAFWLGLIHKNTPAANAMITPLVWTMVSVGLIQAFAWWALASRWLKLALLYGALGLSYWLTLMLMGNTPDNLLRIMPGAAALAMALLFTGWFLTLRKAAKI